MHRGAGFHNGTGCVTSLDTMRSSGDMLVGDRVARAWGTSGAHGIAGALGHVESWEVRVCIEY